MSKDLIKRPQASKAKSIAFVHPVDYRNSVNDQTHDISVDVAGGFAEICDKRSKVPVRTPLSNVVEWRE